MCISLPVPKSLPIPWSVHAEAFCIILPSSHQPPLSIQLANYTFKPSSMLKEIVPLYTVMQLMKMELRDVPASKTHLHVKTSKMKVLWWKPESVIDANDACGENIWGRKMRKMQSGNNQNALSYSNAMTAALWRMGVAGCFFLPPQLSRLCDVCDPIAR